MKNPEAGKSTEGSCRTGTVVDEDESGQAIVCRHRVGDGRDLVKRSRAGQESRAIAAFAVVLSILVKNCDVRSQKKLD